MKDIFKLIQPNAKTFQDFRKWLFVKLNRNEQSFRNFGAYPNNLKIPYLIGFLEIKNVPILEALCYYNYLSSNQATDYEELCLYMISEEFKRIEINKTVNYVPF